jgi:hypothetical protein
VVFYDIQIQWDGRPQPATWSTSFVEDVCNMRAAVVNPSTTGGVVNITWNTRMADPPQELIARSQANKKLGGGRS